ncbi:MAG TPA: hypothetical protein VGE05_03220 [Novosphingobium sp.]
MPETDERLPKGDPRVICFEGREDQAAVEMSVAKLVGALQEQSRAMFVNEHNVMRMNHGGQWVHSAREEEPDTTMHSISTEWLIPFKDIADNDLDLIARTIRSINEDMQRQFAQNMYATVGAVAEKVGNVVDAKATGSIAQSMLEMFKKIEFGVDRDGNVSMPTLHVAPETHDRIVKELQSVDPEVEAEIERVKAIKIQAAFEREADRKSKFKTAEK